jgi:protein-disulfide isomerase
MTNRLAIREKRKKKRQRQRFTTILIVVGIVLIFSAALMVPTIQSAVNPGGNFTVPDTIFRGVVNGNTAGDPDSPVSLKIYSDFGCGYCGDFALGPGIKIFEQYVATGKIFVEFNSVGSMMGHPNSITTAEAAYCAGDQNKFWDFHDILYANQADLFASINLKIDRILVAYADALGLNVEEFTDCIESGKYDQVISEDYTEALQADINSTPTFILNNKVLLGNLPFEEFQMEIERAISQTNQ